MKLVKASSPFLRKDASVERMMLDCVIALLPLTIFTIIVNGINALRVILISVLVMMLAEGVFVLIRRRKNKEIRYELVNILTPIISGIIFALLLPAGTQNYIVIVGALFGIVVAKLVFGGTGSNIFNVAGVARVFISICFPLAESELYNTSSYYDMVAGATPLTNLKDNYSGIYSYSMKDLFIGLAPGSLGEVSKLFILIGALYLIIRRSADFRVILSSLLSFFTLAITAGIAYNLKHDSSFNFLKFGLYELLSGGMVFGACFMLTDPVTGPVTKMGKINYCILVSIITILVRLFGAFNEGCVFAILIGNMFAPAIDYFRWNKPNKTWKRFIMPCALMLTAILIIALAM